MQVQHGLDTWYFPPDIAHDLDTVNLPQHVKGEIYACAWEYTRCVIPQYANWNRYVAFMRTIIIGIIAEFKGSMVDVAASDTVLGCYSLNGVLDALFEGTLGHENMKREYKAFLLITADKASSKRDGELFRRYVNALAVSPHQWFRMRDCDALARFTIASALACMDLDHIYFSDAQFDILCEVGNTMYDGVAFFKHRSEGETNTTFAYMPQDMRIHAFRQCREVLWALDAAWACEGTLIERQCVTNFTRFFGGPIHMMMRRYRFVEEDMTIGRQEDVSVVNQTRNNYKLWNRVDATKNAGQKDISRYEAMIARSDELMFPGLKEFLEQGGDGHCDSCRYRSSYGATKDEGSDGRFGGVELCQNCKPMWRNWLESFPARAAAVFPELVTTFSTAIVNADEHIPVKTLGTAVANGDNILTKNLDTIIINGDNHVVVENFDTAIVNGYDQVVTETFNMATANGNDHIPAGAFDIPIVNGDNYVNGDDYVLAEMFDTPIANGDNYIPVKEFSTVIASGDDKVLTETFVAELANVDDNAHCAEVQALTSSYHPVVLMT